MDVIEKHITELAESRYARATITNRARTLRTLPDPLNMDREATQEWWKSRQYRPDGEPRAAMSLSGESSHVREFWKWAMRQGLIERNPADYLPKVRQARTMAVTVSEGDLYRIMQTAPEPMRRMIALAAMSGLRSAEVAAITWEDIDRTEGVLHVRGGKGAQDRTVPLSAGLLGELGDPGAGPIVGKPMTSKAVSTAIGRHMRRQGVDLTAHKLRARCATRFLAVTGDAVATAQMLGHSDLSSVMRYAVASSDTMRRGSEATGRIG